MIQGNIAREVSGVKSPAASERASGNEIIEGREINRTGTRPAERAGVLVRYDGNSGPGLPGFSGQNPLPIPGVTLAPDEVLLTTQAFVDTVQSLQAKGIVENLRSSVEKIDSANKKKMTALLDRMDKVLKAAEKQKAMKTLGDTTFGISIAVTILSMIGTGLLAFVTGGLATPLLVGAAISAANTLLDGIDRALQNDPKAKYGSGVLEGKQITVTLSGLISTAHEATLKSFPEFNKLSKADQQLILAVMQIVTTVVVTISVSVVGAAAGAKAAAGVAGKIAEKTGDMTTLAIKATAHLVSKTSSAASTIGEIVETAGNIAASFIGAFIAADRLQMNLADNKSQHFSSVAEIESRYKEVLEDVLEKVMEDKKSTAEVISNALRDYHDTQTQISNTS
jgi:hypothetical protein